MTASRWYRYLRFWRRDVRADIDDELRFHFDARVEELIGAGMSAVAARARAIEEFGDVDEVRRGLREIDDRLARRRDRADWFEALRQDVVYSVRSLRKAPAVSLTIIVTLALGLGVNAAMFSLLDAIFLRPPPGVAEPDQVRRVWADRSSSRDINARRQAPDRYFWRGFDYLSFDAMRTALDGRAELALYQASLRLPLANGDDPPMAAVTSASSNYFKVLGARTQIGRFFSADEDRLDAPARVVVVSDAFWRRQLDADERVLGRTLTLGGKPYTIIGVAQPRFTGIDLDEVDVWRPLASRFAAASGGMPWYRNPNVNGFQVLFRLVHGAHESELAQRATAAIRAGRLTFFRDSTTSVRFGAINAARGPGQLDSSVQVATRLGGVALVVLIIACANVVNLLLARAVRRRREIAIRLTLGVSRGRLTRLLVTESVLLALAAVVAAVLAATWGGTLLRVLLMPEVHWAESPMNWRVAAFSTIAALAAGALAGLVPALQSLAPDLASTLKSGVRQGSTQHSRLRSMLIVVQVALSVVLTVGAALFVRSLDNVQSLDIGYTVDRLAFVSLRNGSLDTAAQRAQSDRLLAMAPRFARIPGVEKVAYTSIRPRDGIQFTSYFPDADTLSGRKPEGIYTLVSPGFFAATGTRLIRGRDFAEGVGPGDPFSVIVNEAFADALWPGGDALGHCIRFNDAGAQCATIIGVVQTAMLDAVTEDPSPHMYAQMEHSPLRSWGVGDVVLRVDPGRINGALTEMRAILRTEFPNASSSSTTMAAAMEPEYRPWRLGATLFTLFGLLALIVAGVGVYSSVSYGVSQRTHEFGVRAALGATTGNVLSQVLREGLRTVSIGVAVGIALALLAGRLVASLLYGVRANDLGAMTIAAIVLLAIAAAASLVPAWRAANADPVEALRAE
jgi:predicted permease